MKRLADNLFRFDSPETDGERLHFKLYEAFLIAYVIGWSFSWAQFVQELETVIDPYGIAVYIDVSRMFGPGAWVNAALTAGAALLGFFRVAPRIHYTIAFLGFQLQYGVRFCLGDQCHAANFVGMGMLSLAAAMWLYDGARDRRRFALGASIFFVGVAYSSAALSKLIASGPLWADGRHLWLWVGEKTVDHYSKLGELRYTFLQKLALSSRPLATLMLGAGLITEASGFLLWFRRFRPYVALSCIGLHLSVYFTMNIMFDMFIYQLVILMLPWAALFDRLLAHSHGSLRQRIDALSMRFA